MKKLLNFLQRIWTSSIRRQLMLGIILVHAVLMTIFVYDLVERQRDFLHTQSIEQTKSLAQTLAANSASWVLANDVIGLEEVLEAQINYPSLRYAMVLSPTGRILGHTEIDKVGLYVNDPISGKLLSANKDQIVLVNNSLSIDVASPIISNDTFIGWARVNLTEAENANNLKVITRNGLLYTLLAIVVGAIFAFFMAKGITQGLKHIVDVAEGIKQGNLRLRAQISRHDEIGTLGKDFNTMLDTIDDKNTQLNTSHSELEELYTERNRILATIDDVIYQLDIDGNLVLWNTYLEEITGLNHEELQGRHALKFFPDYEQEKIAKAMSEGLEKGFVQVEADLVSTDGIVPFDIKATVVTDNSGNTIGLTGIGRNLSFRKEMEQEKSLLEGQLFHAQKMQAIGQLTGGVAHDFNNLLSVILGYAELSMEQFSKNNETLHRYLKEINTAGIRGRDLIQQMMIFSRKDQNDVDTVSLNIEPILDETVRMLKATFPTSVAIETHIQKHIPEVECNASLISQILMNLCINAKDGMEKEGKLSISLTLESFTNNSCKSCHDVFSGEYVTLCVKDDGNGIPEKDLGRIFEPFFTSKRIGEGTGMGLSVVHGIVHKLGGHIMVYSHIGEGTSFKILLPVSDKTTKANVTNNNDSVAYDFSNLNIMVVDDEPAVATLLKESLIQYHANVETFTSSTDALAHFKSDPTIIDLVITDQTMPDLTGTALSEQLLAIKPDLNIILCTGFSEEITEDSALKMGIKEFMYKPVETEELCNAITKFQ